MSSHAREKYLIGRKKSDCPLRSTSRSQTRGPYGVCAPPSLTNVFARPPFNHDTNRYCGRGMDPAPTGRRRPCLDVQPLNVSGLQTSSKS